MESNAHTMSLLTKQRRLLTRSRKTINHLNIACILMLAMLIIMSISYMNQRKQISALQENCISIEKAYNEAVDSYSKLSIEYAEVKTELKNLEEQLSEISKDNNTNLTDPSIQDSNTPSGFVYNPSIPLSEDIQKYAYTKCQESGIEYPIFLGLMRRESDFNPKAASNTNDYGLCQINKINHNWMREVLGSDWDPLNPYDSIDASIFILTHYTKQYKCDNYHVLLMNYNMGHGNAIKCFNEGIYTSKYSRAIMEYAKEYGYSGDGTVNLR